RAAWVRQSVASRSSALIEDIENRVGEGDRRDGQQAPPVAPPVAPVPRGHCQSDADAHGEARRGRATRILARVIQSSPIRPFGAVRGPLVGGSGALLGVAKLARRLFHHPTRALFDFCGRLAGPAAGFFARALPVAIPLLGRRPEARLSIYVRHDLLL